MSMVGTAATREGWPRSRILSAVLAVSLVLNVLFVAGAVWGRIEEAPARGLDRRFERIGAQLDLDATQRAAFDRLLAELRGRGDKVQQQVAPLYRAAWDAAGNPTAGRGPRCFGCSTRLSTSGASSTARRRGETLDFLATLSPEQRGRFVALARERGSWRK